MKQRVDEIHEGEIVEIHGDDVLRCHFYNCLITGSGATYRDCVFVDTRFAQNKSADFNSCLFHSTTTL